MRSDRLSNLRRILAVFIAAVFPVCCCGMESLLNVWAVCGGPAIAAVNEGPSRPTCHGPATDDAAPGDQAPDHQAPGEDSGCQCAGTRLAKAPDSTSIDLPDAPPLQLLASADLFAPIAGERAAPPRDSRPPGAHAVKLWRLHGALIL